MIRLGFSLGRFHIRKPDGHEVFVPDLRTWEADFQDGANGLMQQPMSHVVVLPGGLRLRVTIEPEQLQQALGTEIADESWSAVIPLTEDEGLTILDTGAGAPEGKWSVGVDLGIVKIGWRQ